VPRKKIPYLIPYIKVQDQKWGMPAGSVPYQITRYEMRNPKWAEKYDWKENIPFDSCISFVRLGYGAKSLWRTTDTGAEFYMSQSALADILRTKSVIYGTVIARFQFRKHGNVFSLVLAPP